MIQVNRIYLIFNRLVTKKFLVDTSESCYMRMLEEGRPITLSKALLCFMYEKVQASVFRNLSLRKTRHQRTFFIV